MARTPEIHRSLGNVRVIESLSRPKADGLVNEDTMSIARRDDGTLAFAAVFDGATDKTGVRWGDASGGSFVSQHLGQSVQAIDEQSTAEEAVQFFSRRLDALLEGAPASQRPMASMVMFSVARRQIWRVGDCHAAIRHATDEFQVFEGWKEIDRVTGAARAAYRSALTAARVQMSPDNDPARTFVLPLLKLQAHLANADPSVPFSYGALNGTAVPSAFVEVIDVPESASEVVLATDGYPFLRSSLTASEQALKACLADDPSMSTVVMSPKGVAAGSESFDDRSYLRLAL